MLSRITQKAHNILDEIRKNNVSEEIEKVKAELSHVIFGAGGAESDLCNGSLKDVTGRGAACGNSGLHAKGQSAGNNLVVDFFCLCAQRNDDGIHDACKVKVGSKSEKHSWGDKAPSGSSSMWASIKKECENLLHQHPKSAKEGHEVIDDFWNHLKSGGLYRWGNTRKVDGSERKPGMLGTGAGTEGSGGKDVVCDGRRGYTATRGSGTPPGGICVYYGQEPQWEENIEWLKKLKTAMNTVDVLNNKTATIKRDIEKLHMLLHRAEKVYESAKLITEIQQPVLPTNLQTTAKRLTAYSASRRHHPNTHFFSLFVLL
ncbi:unnamed protein product [Trypanosoma congolense IL3000]|nr:unnamed protein product [Trypanosoma congolense IL3000]